MSPVYHFKILTQGESSWSFLEGMAERLENFINSDESRALQRSGWELWQTSVLNDKQGNNGFMLLFRRPIGESIP
ncbi:hypothetical protein IAD21_05681 [Abditibacteriota bacterium]|nr:hypothetical protein IAD21_05681 [Abditibacteriota bacterium]